MGLFDKSKKMFENFAKATQIKIGQTTKEVFDNVQRDELYSNEHLDTGEVIHIWSYPEVSRKFAKEDSIVSVQIVIKDGVVVDGSHFVIKDKKPVEYILKGGLRDKQQHKDEYNKESGVPKSEFQIICRDKFDCNDLKYQQYLFTTIQYCDYNRPFAFISYSSKDKEKVWADVINLQIKGYNLWIDKNMKETEDSWQSSAIKALDNPNCKLVIFYLSKTSITSLPCLKELKHREENNIPYIVVEAQDIGSFDSFISTVDNTSEAFNDIYPHFISSSRKRIKYSNNKENAQTYFEKIENNLNESGIEQLSNDELYSLAVKMLGEVGGQYSAIALLDYCYSQGYLPAMMLRAFIQEKPIFKDYFTTNNDATLSKLQAISKKDEWLKITCLYRVNDQIEQAAAFYSAYALVNKDIKAYEEASRMWKLVPSSNPILYNSCVKETNIVAYKDGWEIKRIKIFTPLFNTQPLSPFDIKGLVTTNPFVNGQSEAYSITPNIGGNNNLILNISSELSKEEQNLAQIVENYSLNYTKHTLYSSDAGYYAAQLAIWGRIKGIDPKMLLNKADLNEISKDSANKIKEFASILYNDHAEINHGVNFKYNDKDVLDNYILNDGPHSLYRIYDNWYYCSGKMSITTYGATANLSFTVALDGDGFVTTSAKEPDIMPSTLTLGGKKGNIFYVFVPADKTGGKTKINICAEFNYWSSILWKYTNKQGEVGQKFISDYSANGKDEFSLSLERIGLNI